MPDSMEFLDWTWDMTLEENTVLRLVKPQRFSVFRLLGIRFYRLRYRYCANSPFISGDSIANCCDYVAYGRFENKKIDLKKLSKARSIFVPGHLLDNFLREYKDDISASALVVGNSDTNFISVPELPKSITLFICQNLESNVDPKSHTLPIGIENIRLGRTGRPVYHRVQSSFEIRDKILIPPMSPTNLVRRSILKEAAQRPQLFDLPDRYLPEREYFALTRKYRFVFAPEGNGFDSHRVWEVLYQGSIPVVLATAWSTSLAELNLPILYINSISELSKEMLEDADLRYSGLNPKDMAALWSPFWYEAIQSGVFSESPTP